MVRQAQLDAHGVSGEQYSDKDPFRITIQVPPLLGVVIDFLKQ